LNYACARRRARTNASPNEYTSRTLITRFARLNEPPLAASPHAHRFADLVKIRVAAARFSQTGREAGEGPPPAACRRRQGSRAFPSLGPQLFQAGLRRASRRGKADEQRVAAGLLRGGRLDRTGARSLEFIGGEGNAQFAALADGEVLKDFARCSYASAGGRGARLPASNHCSRRAMRAYPKVTSRGRPLRTPPALTSTRRESCPTHRDSQELVKPGEPSEAVVRKARTDRIIATRVPSRCRRPPSMALRPSRGASAAVNSVARL